MFYKPPGAVYIASYKEPLDPSDCWKLFVQLLNCTNYIYKECSYKSIMPPICFSSDNSMHTFLCSVQFTVRAN